MRTYVSLSFHGDRLPGGPENFLRAAGIHEDEINVHRFTIRQRLNVFVRVALPEGDERIAKLIELLKQHDEDPGDPGGFDRYTDEELDNARLLVLRPGLECQVDGGSKFGTTYDLTGACPHCGAGARQTSALFLDGAEGELRKLKGHRAAHTYSSKLLVDDRIAAELEALAPTGLVLHQVYALMPETKRQVKLAYKQLSADRVLPPMAPQTENLALLAGQIPRCSLCTRSGYWGSSASLRVAHRRQDLEGARDVNLSWEGQGHGRVSPNPLECWIPTPLILVTPKVMRVFRNAGVTEFEWVPIRVVDE